MGHVQTSIELTIEGSRMPCEIKAQNPRLPAERAT
jgi:hypothetical protein